MNVSTAEAYSILGVMNGAILSKTGAVTIAYYLESPEPYSLDEAGLLKRHAEFCRAFKGMPDNSYVHKQDVFLNTKYDPLQHIKGDSFLQKAEKEHFKGREYLRHYSILAFTIAGLKTLEKAYMANPLRYSDGLVEEDKQTLSAFLEAVEGAKTIIRNIPHTSIRQMPDDEVRHYIYNYVNGFAEGEGLKDIRFSQGLEIGEADAAFFAISSEAYLPDTLPIYDVDDTLPLANTQLHMACLEKLGLHIHANHIYNQVLYFEGNSKLKKELENRVILYGQHRNWSASIKHMHGKLKEFEDEVIDRQSVLCRAHFSVMLWDKDTARLAKAKDAVREVLKLKDIRYYEPTYQGLRDIFIGNVIGRENKLSPSFYFLTELSVALALFINYSVFRDDPEGILFNDRIFQVPLRKDIWDEQKRRIPARNGIVIASTGGGKSATTLNIVQQLVEAGYKVIVCEFGKSFSAIAKLYPDKSAHIDYDGQSPLGVNPFFIRSKAEATAEKLKTLTIIVLKFWRVREIREDVNQVVALTKILRDYYDHTDNGHSFPGFYSYVKEHCEAILLRQEIDPGYFDKKSFLHVCRDFMPGGIYENVCNTKGENEDRIRDKDFIVFELTAIKKDPFLVSLVMSILFDTIENKILSDRSTKGMLVFDEYAETQSMVDVFSGDDVHSTVAFCYQKLRKENGGIMTIIQSPAQLPDNNYTKGMIANTQLLYVLPTTETVYDAIIQAFSIKNQSHINLMKSIRNDFAGERPRSEIYMRFLDLYATVVRLEFSKKRFYAFQTDGAAWQEIDRLHKEHGNMEAGIEKFMKQKQYEKTYT